MNSLMKKATLFLAALAAFVLLCGFGGGGNPLIGTWKSDYQVMPVNRMTKAMGKAGKTSEKGNAVMVISAHKMVIKGKKGSQETAKIARFKVGKNAKTVTMLVNKGHGNLQAHIFHMVKGGHEMFVTASTGFGKRKMYFKRAH